MASPEDQPASTDVRPRYLQIVRFPTEQSAGRAYFQAQDAIFHSPHSDLSVYRLQLHEIYHVTILGDPPPRRLDRTLRSILIAGQPAELPDDILRELIRAVGYVMDASCEPN